ncbi:MAG TPA: copper chaperone PCu(A)C [Casimicrobiaceae bacterium]
MRANGLRTMASIALMASALTAVAHDYSIGALHIDHPYARAMPPGARTAAAYLGIENRGRDADALQSASTPRAASVELHTMSSEGGMMRMREVKEVALPPGRTVTFGPGGLHIMLVDPNPPLRKGDRVPLTLTFARAGTVTVQLDVEAMTAQMHPH